MCAAAAGTPAIDVDGFVDNGYVVAEGVLDAATRDAVCREITRFATGELPVENPRVIGDRSEQELVASVRAINFPHRVSPIVEQTAFSERIAGLAGALAGAHLPRWDGASKHMQSILYNKAPGHAGQPWHQDEVFIPTRDRSLVGVWVALDDATVNNGCLWVIPGSHRMGYMWPTRRTHDEDEHVVSDESFGLDTSLAVPLEVSAGDAVCFNGYTLHASFRNRSSRTRRALVHHFCNAWSLLPWLTPPRDIASTAIGTLDNRAVRPLGFDPYVDRGTERPDGQVFLLPFE